MDEESLMKRPQQLRSEARAAVDLHPRAILPAGEELYRSTAKVNAGTRLRNLIVMNSRIIMQRLWCI